MTTPRHAQPRSSDTHGMTLRTFAGIVGAVAIIAAIAALSMHVIVDYVGALTDSSVDCGTALSPDGSYSNAPAAACKEAISDRRGWSWPLGAVGVVVLLGAILARPRSSTKPVDQ